MLANLETTFQEHLQNDRSAMSLEFQNIFSGKRMRCLEIQCDTFIDDVAVFVHERQKVGISGFQRQFRCCVSEKFRNERFKVLAGNPDNADTAASRRGSDGCNRRRISIHWKYT